MDDNSRGKGKWAGAFRFAKKAGHIASKIILGLVTCAVLLVFYKAVTRAPVAKADSSVYYPGFCLGGWQNPQNAAGQNDLPAGDSTFSDFNITNSAFLGSSVASQIFCGYFPVDSQTNPPTTVTLTFNWAAASSPVTNQTSSNQQTSSTQTSSGNSSSGGGSLSSSSGLIIATSTGFTVATSTPDTSSSSTSPDDSTNSTDSSTTSSTSSSDTSSSATATTTPPSSTPPPATPAPTDDSSDSTGSSSPTSFLYDILSHFAAKALADSSGYSQNAFFSISYSTDGVHWLTSGTVGADNFQNYSMTVPIFSWDDLKALQIRIDALPTVGGKPDIYLESIALNVNYGSSILDDAAAAAAAVNDAANAAADAINTVVQNPPPAPAPTPMTWVKKVSFDFNTASQRSSRKDLPWYPRDFSKTAKTNSFDAGLSFKKNSATASFVVSGKCDAPDYVVLIYRGPNDYINNPASFLYDAASPCASDGTFSFDIASLSLNIPNGTYDLFVGSEGSEGTWVPISPIVPITINSNLVQVPVDSSTTTNQ